MAEERIRRKDYASGPLDEEEEAKLAAHTAEWSKVALCTDPMDVEGAKDSIIGLYKAAKIETGPPPRERILPVSSLLSMAFAGPIISVAWYYRKQKAPESVIQAARDLAARQIAFVRGGKVRKWKAVKPKNLMTEPPPSLLYDNIRKTVVAGTAPNSDVSSEEAPPFDDVLKMAKEMVEATRYWYPPSQPSSAWAGWPCYLTAPKVVLGLEIEEHAILEPLIQAAKTHYYRYLDEDFALVCDRPRTLKVTEQNVPHCEDGPYIRWDDGTEWWYIEGVMVTEQIVMRPETLTPKQIEAEENAEVRRIMIERYGPSRYAEETGAKLVDADQRTSIGGGPRGLFQLNDGSKWLVGTDGSTQRVYWMPVPAEAESCREAHEAIACADESKIVKEC